MAVTSQDTLNERLGSDLKLPIKGSFEPISGLELLLQDIQILLLTSPGERLNRPSFGCGLKSLIWENMETAVLEGPGIITQALSTFEPRINVTEVNADSNPNTGLVSFVIRFAVKSTDTNVNLVFPLRVGKDLSFS
jgi:phage baseplate assembly protein W